ncbi:transmembrane amino acid transporter protein-domain-containing protein [Rhypophila decipiens]|uniref:Transmembrane amino acid transporter protein-domain-containing protein n=1 Tax=Rhypophila decipiens TaxID=261697 RepID=A0AAN7B5F5_9PEZI|nr:transmembrane amino acid transporter protein-domain-containing protein [Rhypophila decipiens]
MTTNSSSSETVVVGAHQGPRPPLHIESPDCPGSTDIEKQRTREIALQGHQKFHRLGWKRLTIVLIVTAIALGSLSLPGAYATLGMVPGVILTIGLGMVAMYTSYVVGQMKIKYPQIAHFADVGKLMFGRTGYEILGVMFSLQLIFTTGSHVLTGKIMFNTLTEGGACSIVFGVVSAVILFALAIPPSFAEMAVLGYVDFGSIVAAIVFTMIATGIKGADGPGGLAAVNWSAWPKENLSVSEAFIAIANIVFAYSFSLCQFSFMDEMHTPEDFPKSILSLGIIEIVIYTLTGALVYAFVGQDVQSPALLSAGPLLAKVAFGIAIPVIFISGSINTVVVGRYLHARMFRNSVVQYINTPMGWATWIGLGAALTVLAWVIAEAIPFFSPLLAICSSLFISGFTFYIPAVMWFWFIKQGKWYELRNLPLSIMNALCFAIGMIVLGLGTYSSIQDILDRYEAGTVNEPFTCAAP